MKKILFVFNHPAPYKIRLFNELAKKVDLTVLFERGSNKDRNDDFYFEKNINFKTAKIHGIKIGKENFISNQIKKHLKKNKYDLVIMNGYSTFAEMNAINYLKKNHIKYLFYINGGIIRNNESSLKRKIKTHFIKGATWYFSPDLNSNKYLVNYGADENCIINYPYSTLLDSEILQEELNEKEKLEIRDKYSLKGDKIFVSSGQLIKRKNYLSLIESWMEMPDNYSLYIFGEGPERSKIEKFIAKNNIKNVFVPGYLKRADLFNCFKASDIFVFPSNEDIYGHVVLEALSQGLPVISTKNVNSSLMFINNNYNGFILKDFSSENLKKAVNSLLKNNLTKNCFESVMNYSIEKTAEHHLRWFDEVIK